MSRVISWILAQLNILCLLIIELYVWSLILLSTQIFWTRTTIVFSIGDLTLKMPFFCVTPVSYIQVIETCICTFFFILFNQLKLFCICQILSSHIYKFTGNIQLQTVECSCYLPRTWPTVVTDMPNLICRYQGMMEVLEPAP